MSRAPTTAITTDPGMRSGDIELPAQRRDEPPTQHVPPLGHRLRSMRWSRGWSLRELARRTGMDRHVLSCIEAGGRTALRLKGLWRLAHSLGVHWADLLDDRAAGRPVIRRAQVTFEQQMAAFGARVSQLRAQRQLTEHELAARVGTKRATMIRIERGAQNITVDTLLRLAAALGVHGADLLDDRPADARDPVSRLHEALAQADQLRAELGRMRTQLILAQARAAVAAPVAERAAPKRIAAAVGQARLIVDHYDRLYLAALNPTQLAAQLEGRRALSDYLDRMWHDGQRHGLDERPEWSILIALRDLAEHLMSTALDVQRHAIGNHAKDSNTGRLPMTTTPSTHTPAAREHDPPTPEQLLAAVVAWLSDMPAVRRALTASALVNNRWKPSLAAVYRQAVAQLLAAAEQHAVPDPYGYVAMQLGVADADVDGQPITGDRTEPMQRPVR